MSAILALQTVQFYIETLAELKKQVYTQGVSGLLGLCRETLSEIKTQV